MLTHDYGDAVCLEGPVTKAWTVEDLLELGGAIDGLLGHYVRSVEQLTSTGTVKIATAARELAA